MASRQNVQRVAGMNLDGASDGRPRQGSQGGGSQGGSRHDSPSQSGHSRSGSGAGPGGIQAGSASGNRPNPYGKGLGYDPAIDPNDPKSSRIQPMTTLELVGKNVDLPAEAYQSVGVESRFTKRPGFNTEGKPIKVMLNLFSVETWPSNDVYQYDVNVTPNPRDSRALVKKVWNSAPVQEFLRSVGGRWLYDGNKLAWNPKQINVRGEHRMAVDLDALSGKTAVGRDGVYYITIKQSAKIRMEYLKSYLMGQSEWDSHVLECMNLLDHVMRQWPSENMLSIKRNFYDKSLKNTPQTLDMYTCIRKGTYSAFKLSEFSTQPIGGGLSLNVDVANTAFWIGNETVAIIGRYMLSPPNTKNIKDCIPVGKMSDMLRPVRTVNKNTGKDTWTMSDSFKKMRRMQKLRFTVTHRGKTVNDKTYTIKSIIFDPKYGAKGADAVHFTFDRKDKDGNVKRTTIFDYFKEKYGGVLQYPDLPLVESTRDGVFPMEVCTLARFQRYAFKLDPEQTSNMIKYAVSRPEQRLKDIMNGVKALNWPNDPYFKDFGLRVSTSTVISSARLLQNPEIHFGGSKINPGVAGRWDLRGKTFLEPNIEPLKSWAFIGCGQNDAGTVQLDHLKNFATAFTRAYKGHGGKIVGNPYITTYPYAMNYGDMCKNAYEECGKTFKQTPQIIFFVVATKNQLVYERIKKNMDCRFCVMSQVLNSAHVVKASPQYCSNVAMKVNAKLGGITAKAMPVGAKGPVPYYTVPTMFVGLDVSHGSVGTAAPSMAAMSVSMDKMATKYAAACETNGYRVEIVSSVTMTMLFERLLKVWVGNNGTSPKHVYLFRDGVSEGQYQHVVDYEMKELKRIFKNANLPEPKFTIVVATKRHHIRFFPKVGDSATADKNGNAHPGTLVEYNATHPFHFDFYLASHSALIGTARPVHYSVIYDEVNVQPNMLQKMIYHHCYQYARSTTPVSLHPAVYYAHLASQRARSHEDVAASAREVDVGKEGFPIGQALTQTSGNRSGPAPPLVAMNSPVARPESIKAINTRMWYI